MLHVRKRSNLIYRFSTLCKFTTVRLDLYVPIEEKSFQLNFLTKLTVNFFIIDKISCVMYLVQLIGNTFKTSKQSLFWSCIFFMSQVMDGMPVNVYNKDEQLANSLIRSPLAHRWLIPTKISFCQCQLVSRLEFPHV